MVPFLSLVPILIENWSLKFHFFKLKMVPQVPFFEVAWCWKPVMFAPNCQVGWSEVISLEMSPRLNLKATIDNR